MLAFLLAWMPGEDTRHRPGASVALMALALASAFGLSIYVAFGFFLVMLVWAIWQFVIERRRRSVLLLAAGGAGAAVLLIPYLRELTRSSSGLQGGGAFAFTIREMFSPDSLLASHLLKHLAMAHPVVARNVASSILLVPGYVFELGFYLAVLLIYLIPAWRGRTALTAAQRSLVVIAVAALLMISVLGSSVLKSNDFGWRASLLLQFPLLLMGSEVVTSWRLADGNLLGIDHQTAIAGDQSYCGAELGGDPSGCPAMAAAIDALFQGTSADQARATCRQYGIQYLVTRVYDPAWKDANGWVWTLKPVVSDAEFRALDCR
jgi:hypothetical protein